MQALTLPTPAWLWSSSFLCLAWYAHTRTDHVVDEARVNPHVLMSLSTLLFAGIWERKHSVLDRFLSDPHSGHSAPQHSAVLHGPMEAG